MVEPRTGGDAPPDRGRKRRPLGWMQQPAGRRMQNQGVHKFGTRSAAGCPLRPPFRKQLRHGPGGQVGDPCWDRTSDTLIKSQVLYRLS